MQSDDSHAYCYDLLGRISSSVAYGIKQLHSDVRDPACMLYMVLRALDTIEDDTRIEAKQRIIWLKEFIPNIGNPDYKLENVGDRAEYVELMENYRHVANVFNSLHEKYRKIIVEINDEMSIGMAYFIENEIITCKDLDKYCYYVGGLSGVALARIFAASGLESEEVGANLENAIPVGHFLQNTNITRDYFDDTTHERYFWPKEIWGKYTDDKKSFLNNGSEKAVLCLNEMIT